MRGPAADLSLVPLDRKLTASRQQQAGRSGDASPSRGASHGAVGSQRGGPFPPVPRPGTTLSPYLLSGPRRQLHGGAPADAFRALDGGGSAAALPRLDSGGPGLGPSPGASNGPTGSSGPRQASHHPRGATAPGTAQPMRNGRGANGQSTSPTALASPSSAPPTREGSGAANGITWAHVRDAQQHAWAESSGLYSRSQHFVMTPAAQQQLAQQFQQQQQQQQAPQAQFSLPDVPSWTDGASALAGGSSSLSLNFPVPAGAGFATPSPAAVALALSLTAARGGGGGRTATYNGGDLAELERDLRERERDMFLRNSWSAGSPAGWGADRVGSPLRGGGAGGAAGASGPGASAAAGLLAFESMVGPPFSSLGLVETPMAPAGGALALAAAGMTPSQIQAVQQQQAQVHTLQRRTLMLRLPHAWESVGQEMSAMVVQNGGGGGKTGGGVVSNCACLLVLPSDKPATRSEAMAVESLLLEMLRDPETAAARAAAWRADALGSLCSEAIACLNEASKLRQAPGAAGAGGIAGSGGGPSGGGGISSGAGGAGQAPTASDGGGQWQIRGLDVVRLSPPSILAPFTTLLQPSLHAHTAAIEAQRAGLASAHARSPSTGHASSGPGTGAAAGSSAPQLAVEASSGSAFGGGGPGGAGESRRGRRLRSSVHTNFGGGGGGFDPATARSANSLVSPFCSASLTVGVCVCLADIIRQVEVQCCERGRALACAWNTFMVAHQDSVDSLRRRIAGLQKEVEQLTVKLSERQDFTREIEMLEFLKRENARFKSRESDLLARGLLVLQAAAGARDGSRLVVRPGGALGEAVGSELTARIARLRWQHALHTMGTNSKRVAFQSGLALQRPPAPSPLLTAGGPETEVMVTKVGLLQRLTLAVERAERRRVAAEARRKTAAEAAAGRGQHGHSRYGNVHGLGGSGGAGALLAGASPAAVAAAGPGAGLRLIEGLDPENTANLMAALSVEAQVVLLTSLPELRRAEVLAAMSDADRAQVVVVMSSGMRAHTARVLGRGMWQGTVRSIKDNPQLGARLLANMDQQEAVDELLGWSLSEQHDVFAALDLPTAARLMAAVPSELRQKLLASMVPHLAANVVSAMLSSPAAASLDELEFNRSVAILMAMDPAAAASVLQEMGTTKAAEALLGMDSLEARNSILESMMPRLAAETLLEMDTRASLREAGGGGADDDIDLAGLSFIGAGDTGAGLHTGPFPGTEALGEMAPGAADKILGFMGVQDKAATLSRMDPERAAEQLALLAPSESVALLACLGEAQQALVVEALEQEDRETMMKVLADASGFKFRGGRNSKVSKANGGRKGATPTKHPANARAAGGGGAPLHGHSTSGAGGGGSPGLQSHGTESLAPQTSGPHPQLLSNGNGGPPPPGTADHHSSSAAAAAAGSSAAGSGHAGAGTSGALGPSGTPRASVGGGGPPARVGYNSELAMSMSAVVNRKAREFIEDSDNEGAEDLGGGGGEGGNDGGGGGSDGPGRWSVDGGQEGGVYGSAGGGAAGVGGSGLSPLLPHAPRPPGGARPAPGGGGGGRGEAGQDSASVLLAGRESLSGAPADLLNADGRRTPDRPTYGTVDGAEDDSYVVIEDGAFSDDGLLLSHAVSGAGGGGATASPGGAPATPGAARYGMSRRSPRATDGDIVMGIHSSAGVGGSPPAAFRRHRSSDMDGQGPAQMGGGGGRAHGGHRRSTAARMDGLASPNRGAYGSSSGTPFARATPPASRGSPGYGGDGHNHGGRPSVGGGSNNLAAIKTAFRINKQQQQQGGENGAAYGGNGGEAGGAAGGSVAPIPDIGQLLRTAGPAGGLPGKSSAMGQLLLGAFRDGPAVTAPQLGMAPKNARLAYALLQHRAARPRPKGWLMGLVESVYKDGDAVLRKMGVMEALRRQSVPEIVFAHFSNKYGQRSLVDEYAACLANTLALHRAEDLRLEIFARFLSEQWNFATFFDFLTASSLALQPSKTLCVEYPREAGRDEQYPWLCTHKAVAIADAVLGPRAAPVRDRFNEALLAVSVPADDSDVEKLKRDPRYTTAAADAAAGTGPPLPERFFRLPRPRFLALLASEVSRLNTAITRVARSHFAALDPAGRECVPTGAVPGYLCGVVAPKTPPAGNSAVQEASQTFIADALAYQLDPSGTAMGTTGAGDGESPPAEPLLTLEAWLAASVRCPLLRDHVKHRLLKPRRLDMDDDGGDEDGSVDSLLGGFLMGVTRRHTRLLAARLRNAARAAAEGTDGTAATAAPGVAEAAALVSELGAALDKATSGGDKFRAYAQMLIAIIKQQVAAAVGLLLGDKGAAGDNAGSQLEDALCRLEDCALIMLQQTRYLLHCDALELQFDLVRRLPPAGRIFGVGRQLLLCRKYSDTARHMAAMVVQTVWRGHRRRKRAAAAAAAGDTGSLAG